MSRVGVNAVIAAVVVRRGCRVPPWWRCSSTLAGARMFRGRPRNWGRRVLATALLGGWRNEGSSSEDVAPILTRAAIVLGARRCVPPPNWCAVGTLCGEFRSWKSLLVFGPGNTALTREITVTVVCRGARAHRRTSFQTDTCNTSQAHIIIHSRMDMACRQTHTQRHILA